MTVLRPESSLQNPCTQIDAWSVRQCPDDGAGIDRAQSSKDLMQAGAPGLLRLVLFDKRPLNTIVDVVVGWIQPGSPRSPLGNPWEGSFGFSTIEMNDVVTTNTCTCGNRSHGKRHHGWRPAQGLHSWSIV